MILSGLILLLLAYLSFRIVLLVVRLIKYIFFKEYKQKVILVVGDTGSGKTSKVTADVIKYNKKMRKLQVEELTDIYAKYNKNGFSQVEIPKTFIYSDIDIVLKGTKDNPKEKSNYFEFENLSGLVYSKEKELLKLRTELLPIGAVGVFDEIANKVDSRNSQSLDDGFSALLRLHRKAYYNFIFMYPQFMDADKRVRQNCHEIQKVIKMQNFYVPFTQKLICTRWTYISYTGTKKQFNCESGRTTTKLSTFFKKFFGYEADVEKKSKWFFGNIFDHYESRAEISYFMKSVQKFKETKQADFEYSRKFTQYYVKTHPAFMPEEKQKRKSTIRRELKEIKDKENTKNDRLKNRDKSKVDKK